jgi:hypothetical protein
MSKGPIQFVGHSFCFTGKMAELKRTQAEREARSRGGHTVDIVNERLDYLVVGSIPSTGWKFKSYGRKIEAAREVAVQNRGRPRLLSESAFMEALANAATTNSGAIDAKVLVINYRFVAASENAFDGAALEAMLKNLQDGESFHITTRGYYALAYCDLFEEPDGAIKVTGDESLIVECRLVKQLPVGASSGELVERVTRGFESISGVDGTLRSFERTEGAADYVRLLREVPQNLRVEGL